MKINPFYLVAFAVLLAIEILIALFVHDSFVRPYVGDILVVILLYTLIRGTVRKPPKLLPLYLFLFAAAVEFAQYFHIVKLLRLENNALISTVIGNTFAFSDILCYFVAVVLLFIWQAIEKIHGGDYRAGTE